MPELDIGCDFDAAEKLSGAIPEGDYKVQVSEVKLGETGANSKIPGTPKIDWEFTVIEHQEFAGRKLFMTTPVSPDGKGLNYLVALTKALGKPWSGKSLNTENYVGLSCRARVIQDEYNGAINNKIKKVF